MRAKLRHVKQRLFPCGVVIETDVSPVPLIALHCTSARPFTDGNAQQKRMKASETTPDPDATPGVPGRLTGLRWARDDERQCAEHDR